MTRVRLPLLLVALVAVACRKGGEGSAPPGASASAPSASSSASAGLSAAAPAVIPARCRAAGPAIAIASAQEELELGDAVPFADGYAMALAHRTAAGRVAGVALVAGDLAASRTVDLGPTLGDAPPPRLAVRGGQLLAAAYALPKSAAARELRLYAVTRAGEVRLLGALPQRHDDSLAADLAPGLVAWDETSPGASPRGVVRVADVSADHPGAPRDVSPPESDAEMPRIVPVGAGYLVLWLARRPEPGTAPVDAAAAAEATGEPRAFSWLEATWLDGTGATVGTLRRLTPVTGHVSGYDATLLPGDGKPTVLVVARDDGESVDGSGGALLRVRVREDGAEPAVGLPGDGLGRGSPALVEGQPRGSPGWARTRSSGCCRSTPRALRPRRRARNPR